MEHTRVFWIYFVITLFFIIIGLASLFTGNVPAWISIFWLLSIIFLMIAVFNSYIESGQTAWINILFIIMLVISYMWTFELKSQENNLDAVEGIALLLFGLIISISTTKYTISFWSMVIYLLIWFVITVYSLISLQ